MADSSDTDLFEAFLDSWNRNNRILLNLLGALPDEALQIRAMEGSPSIAELLAHMHSVRMVFVHENAPEFVPESLEKEWESERDPQRLAQMLSESVQVVGEAVKARWLAGRDLDRHYDHPILFLQHMIWHEGYHHGQIKLALKLAGIPLTDKQVGRATWGVWMKKA